jgi:hypothetical protein
MALESMLGVEVSENQVFLHWPLTSFVCIKANLDTNLPTQKVFSHEYS